MIAQQNTLENPNEMLPCWNNDNNDTVIIIIIIIISIIIKVPVIYPFNMFKAGCYPEEWHSIRFRIQDRTRSNPNVSSPPWGLSSEECLCMWGFQPPDGNKEWLVVTVDLFCPLLYNTCVNINSVTVTTLCYSNNMIKPSKYWKGIQRLLQKKPSIWVH